MPKNIKEERYRWIKPILDKHISIKDMTNVCPFSKRTLKRWLASYRQDSMIGFEPELTRPKSSSKETLIHVEERVIEARRQTDRKFCRQIVK